MASDELCRACGLCCDGTLFTKVQLTASESAAAVQLAGSGRSIAQRCPALDGTACRIYRERPVACRGYRCLLLIAHEADEVSLDDALKVVAQTRARLAEVEAVLPSPEPSSPAQPLERARRSVGLPGHATEVIARTEEFLRFHFLGHQRGHSLSQR